MMIIMVCSISNVEEVLRFDVEKVVMLGETLNYRITHTEWKKHLYCWCIEVAEPIYEPISSALNATGRLSIHNNLLASIFISIAFVSSAISGASGNAAANN